MSQQLYHSLVIVLTWTYHPYFFFSFCFHQQAAIVHQKGTLYDHLSLRPLQKLIHIYFFLLPSTSTKPYTC